MLLGAICSDISANRYSWYLGKESVMDKQINARKKPSTNPMKLSLKSKIFVMAFLPLTFK